ncbi:hypothetical protein HN51_067993 [Arachis hypogaea]|nr:uncharacterized protein DS421_14g481760 [Arachis hypogaea]
MTMKKGTIVVITFFLLVCVMFLPTSTFGRSGPPSGGSTPPPIARCGPYTGMCVRPGHTPLKPGGPGGPGVSKTKT